ncbi:hypothetical protein RFI_11171 [Reticulomyxa filosa]|uniref:Uncharacterized protein n=1 Tax=Reticulomyxa filosa TaxID=46433 RepID=X6NKS7_RETFI|nr:hypothetical protein RFI_11171 [Reticulomyxa filosa]|eukprot:ETO25967.1 hypothetical protein RFI_11171 [Reticulomyxa filosa]
MGTHKIQTVVGGKTTSTLLIISIVAIVISVLACLLCIGVAYICSKRSHRRPAEINVNEIQAVGTNTPGDTEGDNGATTVDGVDITEGPDAELEGNGTTVLAYRFDDNPNTTTAVIVGGETAGFYDTVTSDGAENEESFNNIFEEAQEAQKQFADNAIPNAADDDEIGEGNANTTQAKALDILEEERNRNQEPIPSSHQNNKKSGYKI